MKTPASRNGRRYGALAAAVTMGMASITLPFSPARAAEATVDDAVFSWAVNEESGGGAYFGGANWMVAGEVGNVHGERGRGSSVWDAQDEKHYTAESGNTTITRPNAEGEQIPATWEKRNFAADGTTRLNTQPGSSSNNQANIASGTGTVDAETNSAEIQWDGSFTMVYYGGMTYWSINDPKLVVEDGVGKVTATLTGYGADMNDLSKWVKLDAMPDAEIATLTDVEVTEDGIQVTPEYEGVEIDVEPDGPSSPQNRDKDGWGSFPQDWVDFNVGTGQAAYWYTSGGQVDAKKTAEPITIEYTSEVVEEEPEAPAEFSGETSHEVTAASAEDGLDVTINGSDYENLPKAATGKDAVGVYSAIIDREKTGEFESSDVLGAQLSFFQDRSKPNSFSKVSEVEVDELDEDAEYDAVVWAAHGNGTDETVVYREPIELTDEQREALFTEDDATEEPTEEPSEEPSEEPTEDPSEEPSEEPTEEPSADPSEEPSDDATDDSTEDPSDEPSDDATDDSTEDPSDEPSDD
ncbi:MAG TPA: HtaA domain-containing protein, partial [Candidatus Brevibacterium intestinigallinarum]|nr:HtaA domain-containing protein [Candidatus Brevibacterium intestinigallinarum]